MKSNTNLHILNGQAMENHFNMTHLLQDEMMVAFNEAMCWGEVTSDIFSEAFIKARANTHDITTEEYKTVTMNTLAPLISQSWESIILWFDFDMFCQMNLLTILGWLDQINHSYPVEIRYVNDRFKPVEQFIVEISGYHAIYKQIFIDRTIPKHLYPDPLRDGIKLYLNYLHPSGKLLSYIRKYQHLPEQELVQNLLATFSDYGLGDTQYIALIRANQ